MTANHAHTPTTEVVKDAACFPRDRLGEPRGIDTDAFDRWLATVEAAAEQRGAVKALRDASKSWFTLADQMDHAPGKYYAGFWIKECADLLEGYHA